jgi:hypothetical protein
MNLTIYFLILFVIVAAVVAILVFVLAGKHKITERHKKLFRDEWKNIVDINGSNPELALMKADKLLDHALKIMGYSGTLGDKLKKSGNLFHDINGLWEAHKARNMIAHEVGYKLSPNDSAKHLIKFKNSLKDLGVNFK